MNIIITETFKKDFLKIFKSKLFIENFTKNLKNLLINNKNISFYKLKYEKNIEDIENNNFKIY